MKKVRYDTSSFQVPLKALCVVILIGIGGQMNTVSAQSAQLPSDELKKLSLEELMNVEVTSVSKSPEKLAGAASAIQVITRSDIRSSGAKTVAEALRLAPNLQVAQVNASQWAISARGFNNVLANKLLVLIDGRTIYTPLYAGVFWDIQNLVLEDVDRIEVISGPGGTLWGANAVNGVINIITRSSNDTKGLFAEAATGSNVDGLGSLRYGGQLSKGLSYRVYGTGFKLNNTLLEATGLEAKDKWSMLQGGVRLDWEVSEKDQVTLQQNIYSADPNPDGTVAVDARGSNIVARWNRNEMGTSGFQLQAYYDHTWRDFKNGFSEDLKTYDLDWHSRVQLGKRHELSYGTGFRLLDHEVTNLELFRMLPAKKQLYLYNLFLQDEIQLIEERLRLTIGSKIEHNSYTGFEFQPNARIAWTPANHQTIWAAVSRAVRTPSRIDRDFFLNASPAITFITGNDNFISEKMIAYELGWRLQPLENLSISLATFHNVYKNIRSVEPLTAAPGFPVNFGNGVQAKTYGIELNATYQLISWWNLRGGYTYLKKDLSLMAGSRDLNKASAESNDPSNQFLVQSTINLSSRLEIGTVLRYIDELPKPYVPEYFSLDARIGWHLHKKIELSIVGQNLLSSHHTEFIPSSPSARQIEHSIYGKLSLSY